MRATLTTTEQGAAKRSCRRCLGRGTVKMNGKSVVCVHCSGKGAGYATKGKGDKRDDRLGGGS
jgi:hypothetical protein